MGLRFGLGCIGTPTSCRLLVHQAGPNELCPSRSWNIFCSFASCRTEVCGSRHGKTTQPRRSFLRIPPSHTDFSTPRSDTREPNPLGVPWVAGFFRLRSCALYLPLHACERSQFAPAIMSESRPSRTGENERSPQGTPGFQSIPLQSLHDRPQDGRLQAASQSPGQRSNTPGLAPPSGQTAYWNQPYGGRPNEESSNGEDDGDPTVSPIDPTALQFALPPGIDQPSPGPTFNTGNDDPYVTRTGYFDETPTAEHESDTAPLTSRAQPMAGSLTPRDPASPPRFSFQTVSDIGVSPSRSGDRQTRLDLDPGRGDSLIPGDFRRSGAPSSTSGALSRAGSIARAMSQRIVNISGEGEDLERRPSRRRSRSPTGESRRQTQHQPAAGNLDTSYSSQLYPTSSSEEKPGDPRVPMTGARMLPVLDMGAMNPLKGRSLGIFSPENPIRKALCELLIHPWTEFIILLLIVLQAILLTVEAAPNVFAEGNARPDRWGRTRIDWALLGLFIIFSLETTARIIVSGFVLNAAEYSTIDRKRGVKAAIADQYKLVFQPERQKSLKTQRPTRFEPAPFVRSLTFAHTQTKTIEDHRRWQLARRAFLRHGFNRLDFVAIVAFWMSFLLGVSGLEKRHHLYVFKMLSCLRIVRLLALTNGTAVRAVLYPLPILMLTDRRHR